MNGWVYVKGPDGTAVYVNGNYESSPGTANAWFAVEFGPNRFEAIDADQRPILRAEATVTREQPQAEVELQAVSPEEEE